MLAASQVVDALVDGGLPAYRQAFQQQNGLLDGAAIDTELRLAHFMAQMLAETGGLKVGFEDMSYHAPRILVVFGVGQHSAAVTPAEAEQLAGHGEALAERVYGLGNPHLAKILGNTQPGDGFRYRGGGLMQTTGRGNYQRYSEKTGVDYVGNPNLILAPGSVLQPAVLEWQEGDINHLADADNIVAVTLKINGGLNGLADRKDWFARVHALLQGGAVPPVMDTRALQHALNRLGANPVLDEDGVRGPATIAAIKAFQTAAGLNPDGAAGPDTLAAIAQRLVPA